MKTNTEAYKIAMDALTELLKPGDTVYSVIRSVARSGMSRCIDFYVIRDNRPRYLTGYMANIGIGTRTDNGLRIGGCGMDMCFHCVNTLSMKLFCPDKYTHEGAYALKSERI